MKFKISWTSIMTALLILWIVVGCCNNMMDALAQEPDHWVYLPIAVKDYVYMPPTPTPTVRPTNTPEPTSTPTPEPQSQRWVQNSTGGTLCYEVIGSGVGEKCYTTDGEHWYGTFSPGMYQWVATAPCWTWSGLKMFLEGDWTAVFECPDTPTPSPTNTSEPTPTPTMTLTNTPTPTPEPLLLLNGDFEEGLDGSWTEYMDWPRMLPLVNTFMQRAGFSTLEGHGSWLGWLGGVNADPWTGGWEVVTSIAQWVTVPQGEGTMQYGTHLCFEYLIYSEDWWDYGGDEARLFIDDTEIAYWDIINSNSSVGWILDWNLWHEMCVDVTSWQGENVTIKFEMINDFIWQGDFHVDNIEFSLLP